MIQDVVQDQDWSQLEGLLVWRVNKEGKTVLPNGQPKPCKPIPMKNVDDIIKSIKLHTILGSSTGSRCGWIISPPIWDLDRLLDTCLFCFDGPSPR